jgi:hypothetical protein
MGWRHRSHRRQDLPREPIFFHHPQRRPPVLARCSLRPRLIVGIECVPARPRIGRPKRALELPDVLRTAEPTRRRIAPRSTVGYRRPPASTTSSSCGLRGEAAFPSEPVDGGVIATGSCLKDLRGVSEPGPKIIARPTWWVVHRDPRSGLCQDRVASLVSVCVADVSAFASSYLQLAAPPGLRSQSSPATPQL